MVDLAGTDPTEAEVAVLELMSKPRMTVKAAAMQLGIGENAARSRLSSLYTRLGVENSVQAYALLHGDERVRIRPARLPREMNDRRRIALATRFHGGYDRGDGCWLWRRGRLGSGYGKATGLSGSTGAHRVAWEFANGPIPRGMWVLHRCDNPLCVRPDHLFLGTALDNTADMLAKGRDRSRWIEQRASNKVSAGTLPNI